MYNYGTSLAFVVAAEGLIITVPLFVGIDWEATLIDEPIYP